MTSFALSGEPPAAWRKMRQRFPRTPAATGRADRPGPHGHIQLHAAAYSMDDRDAGNGKHVDPVKRLPRRQACLVIEEQC